MKNWKQIKSLENRRDTFLSKPISIKIKVKYE
jgi:hypothetical protein